MFSTTIAILSADGLLATTANQDFKVLTTLAANKNRLPDWVTQVVTNVFSEAGVHERAWKFVTRAFAEDALAQVAERAHGLLFQIRRATANSRR